MTTSSPICAHCGYEISTYSETLESLEGGGICLLCGGEMDCEQLSTQVDAWRDGSILAEGEQRAETEGEFLDEEEELLEGTPDFGDEGEDEEDTML
jgi:hypothetical protein